LNLIRHGNPHGWTPSRSWHLAVSDPYSSRTAASPKSPRPSSIPSPPIQRRLRRLPHMIAESCCIFYSTTALAIALSVTAVSIRRFHSVGLSILDVAYTDAAHLSSVMASHMRRRPRRAKLPTANGDARHERDAKREVIEVTPRHFAPRATVVYSR
jgi:hypothetical protein